MHLCALQPYWSTVHARVFNILIDGGVHGHAVRGLADNLRLQRNKLQLQHRTFPCAASLRGPLMKL